MRACTRRGQIGDLAIAFHEIHQVAAATGDGIHCRAGIAASLASNCGRLSDSEEIGVSEFIISCDSTRVMSIQAFICTASSSPDHRLQ